MELFLNHSVEFEKTAAEVTLPEDPNQWPHEILQELYKQVPYISDFEPRIVMDRVDGERAFGFGHVDVQNKTEAPAAASPQELEAAGVRQARIPIVIKEGKLQPLDLIITSDAKMLPLTENRLRQAIFRPQMFDITSKTPGDLSMIGQLYPPQRSNFGYGGAGVAFGAEGLGKTSAVKEALDLSTIGSYLKKQKDPQGLARASKSLLGRGAQQVVSGATDVGRKTLLAGNIAAQRAGILGAEAASGLSKGAADLTAVARDKIKQKNFAIPAKKSDTGEGAYPIHDKAHASNALARVDQHGTPSEKAQVYAAIAKKYPELAHRSSVPALQHKVEKTSSLLSSILPTINVEDYTKFAARFTDDTLRAAYSHNQRATGPAMGKLASYQGWSTRNIVEGIVHSMLPSVMQITKVAEGYSVKTASHNLWLPKESVVDRGQLVKMAGVKTALDADLNGSVTMVSGASVDRDLPDAERPEQVKDFGIWKVKTTEGEELVGYVFPTLVDLDGVVVPISLFTNGSEAALQTDISGVKVGEGASLFEGRPRGKGIFFKVLSSGRAVGTVPITIHAELETSGSVGLMAETMEGLHAHIVCQSGVAIPTKVEEGSYVIPADWSWLPLDKADSVVLVEHAEDFGKQAEAAKVLSGVHVRGGPSAYSISGPMLDKLGSDRTQFLSFDDAVFLLGGLGVAPAYAQKKLAEAYTWQEPVFCPISRSIETVEGNAATAGEKTAEFFSSYMNLRKDLVKEAAFIPDPSAVDTVLSLGFINPENVGLFVASLPVIDKTQEKLCELLLASRLGLPDVNSYALERAVKATEEVYEGLHTLAFANN